MGQRRKLKQQEAIKVVAGPACVAGMHRSGTSMIAQLLNKCGVDLGSQEDILGPASDNPDGFWENVQFVKINDEVLSRLGGAWDYPPRQDAGWVVRPEIQQLIHQAQRLVDTFSDKRIWGWKDPRNSLTSPFWEQVIGPGKTRYIVCVRNPLEVARSIYKRSYNSYVFSFNLWYAYNRAIMDNTIAECRIVSHYDAFFANPRQELKRLADFIGIAAGDDILEKACEKIAPRLRHHALGTEDLNRAGAPPELINLYNDLCKEAGPFLERNILPESSIESGPPPQVIHLPLTGDIADKVSAVKSAVRQEALVSIVILTFNEMKYTKECVESLRRHTHEPHEIIFVDNGSTDGTVNWLRQLVSENPGYKLIKNASNMGFARGCNQGISASDGEYVLLLNNDVVVTEHWLSGLLDCLKSQADAGIVGPMTNNISGTQRDPFAQYGSMEEMQGYAREFRKRNRHRRIALRRIVGFCMLFRHELVDQIGLLDENFGTGNYEDDDYCLRAALAGYRNFVAGDVFIHHYGSRSFIGNRINYAETMGGHRKVFSSKWSGIPKSSDSGRRLLLLNLLEIAEELCDKGEIQSSVEKCIEGIGQFPDEAAVYYALCGVLLDQKRYQEALDALAALPEQHREDMHTLLLSGYCAEGLGADSQAEIYAGKVLDADPSHAVALNLRGILAYKRGDRQEAEGFFRKAIESDGGYGDPYTNLGVINWSEGDRSEGIDLLEKGFILSPRTLDNATLYHAALSETGQQGRGEPIFRGARALNPFNQRVTFLLIDLLLQQGSESEAMEIIAEAMATFVLSDDLLKAALAVREKVGPVTVAKGNRKSLSVSMIVKNEEKHIAKCLWSVKPVADEMIVVDTGSADRTKDIAEALGARVYDIKWSGDFSEARNYSLSKAEGDWILSLDADEVIAPADYKALREIVAQSRPAAYKIVTRNYSNEVGAQGFTANAGEYPLEEEGLGWFPSRKVRLFPNKKNIRFENPVHEFVEGTASKAGIPILNCDIPVHHYGRFDRDKLREKGESYYQLGKRKLEEKGVSDLKAIFELGVQAGELGKYNEAAALFEQLVKLNPRYPLAQFNLGLAYMELERYPEAYEYSRLAAEMDPGNKECRLNYAHCELIVGDCRRATELLREVLAGVPGYPPAMVVLAAAQAVCGNKAEAAGIIEKLNLQKFDCTKSLHEIAHGLYLARRYHEAISVYELIVQTRQLKENTRELIEKCFRDSGEAREITSTGIAKGLNPYDRQLSQAEIQNNVHRSFVGGMWDEMGKLQFNFLIEHGLRPDRHFIDVGCGSMRGGIHFIKYLDNGHYHGIDINASLIEAAKRELAAAGLMQKRPHLLVNDRFEMGKFGQQFDYGIAVSVFTHLPMNHIITCLSEMRKVLKPDGVFYATFFEAPFSAHTGQITHEPGGVITNYGADPFHYSFDEFRFMAGIAGMGVNLIGAWNHPRNQRMLSFTVA